MREQIIQPNRSTAAAAAAIIHFLRGSGGGGTAAGMEEIDGMLRRLQLGQQHAHQRRVAARDAAAAIRPARGRASRRRRDRKARRGSPVPLRSRGPDRRPACCSPQSTIDSILRPPNWFEAAAIVRRISASRAGKGGGSLPIRVVRKKTALPSTTAVRSASTPRGSTSSTTCPRGIDFSPSSSKAASQGRSSSRRIFRPACSQTASICRRTAGAMAVASTVRGVSAEPSMGTKSKSHLSSNSLNSRRGLEADHVRQVFIRGRRQLQLPQLDAVAADRHHGLRAAQSAGIEFGGNPPPDLFGRVGRRGIGLAGDGKGLLDHHLAASPGGDHQADLTGIPFQGKKLGHRRYSGRPLKISYL